MKRMRYEFDHWDNAIQGYKETERLNWSKVNAETLKKIHEFAFPEWCHKIEHVHVLDLSEDGYIKPHIDSVKFCGDLIVGLSLLSDSVMRLVGENMVVDALLRRRSLYVMKGSVRYNFTHEILSNDTSLFRDQRIKKSRRISVICRSAPVNTV
ncbi:hypothetical protein AAG570_008051 [Ranatra chinensis]|uniref:Alpha-ketoglutarate-dependent dioxygenase AlkB-like domain-containing protein n=1 Tax=Ranatra chinensis TaxID=642074 RepID=A0ABD0Y6W6_9HEMI